MNTRKKLSLVASALLLSSSVAFAAETLDAAVKGGTVSGDVTLYTGYSDVDGSDKDGYSYGSTGLAYETGSYMGLSAKAGFRAAHVFDGDDTEFANDAGMSEAYIKYATSGFALTVGRQAIGLEWLGSYNEAVVAEVSAIPDTTVVLGYTERQADLDEDEINSFTEPTEDGAYVLDVKYTGVAGYEFNPYFYSAPDAVDFYGLKATYSTDSYGAMAHYAASDVDSGEDGSLLAVEVSTTVAGVSGALGFIKTDKDGGLGAMDTYGDSFEPMDDGSAIYAADAEMIYGSLGYSIAGIDLGAAYSVTDIASDDEKELNLTAGYSITDSLSASLLYVDIDTEINTDQNYGSLTLAYSF